MLNFVRVWVWCNHRLNDNIIIKSMGVTQEGLAIFWTFGSFGQ